MGWILQCLAFSNRLFGCLFVFLLLAAPIRAATIYVPDDQPTIQDAINAASPGDTVIVRPGTYPENINYMGKDVAVMSESGPAVTVIDGGQSGSVAVFTAGEGPGAVLQGFTVTNGTGTFVYNGRYGGGVFCRGASPVITGNVITANLPDRSGGGVSLTEDSAATITNNIISGNTPGYSGGGIYCVDSAPVITGNTITGNHGAGDGGGIYCYCFNRTPVISGNIVEGNSAACGGGICCRMSATDTVIESNVISDNTAAQSGGGIYGRDLAAILCNVIAGNAAGLDGGGIHGLGSSLEVAGNVLCGNSAASYGGGIFYRYGSPMVTNNTITRNRADLGGGGIGLFVTGSGTIAANTIVWDNTAPEGPGIRLEGESTGHASLTAVYCDIEGGLSSIHVGAYATFHQGPGNIAADPLLFDPAGGDCHIALNSPCRNTGSAAYTGSPTTDFEGDPREALGGVDMGADEFWVHLYLSGAAVPGGSVFVRVCGFTSLPVTLFLGAGIQDPPAPTPHGDLFITWPPLWQKALGVIPPGGILSRPATVPASWHSGEEYPFQALAGPWGGPYTRFTNLMVVEVE